MTRRVRAKKSLGQNFLIDPSYQRKIVGALELVEDDEVIEIGPGTGAITQHMVGKVRRFTALELDDELAAALRERYAANPSFRLIHQDVMTVDLAGLAENIEALKAVGNIPYNITSPLIFKLLEREARPARIVVMVQKEVADRIVASPGQKDFGALTVGIQAVADTQRLFVVPRGAFRPVPNVDSAVVRIVPRRPFQLSADEEIDLRELTRSAFAMRRKQVQKILRSAAGYQLHPDEIAALQLRLTHPLTVRPEDLAPAQFIQLSRELKRLGYPKPDGAN